MSFPKLRLTIGNIIGLATVAAGFIVNHAAIITAVTSSNGGKLAGLGAVVLTISKGILSFNADSIPNDKKLQAGPIVVEKTGPLKTS